MEGVSALIDDFDLSIDGGSYNGRQNALDGLQSQGTDNGYGQNALHLKGVRLRATAARAVNEATRVHDSQARPHAGRQRSGSVRVGPYALKQPEQLATGARARSATIASATMASFDFEDGFKDSRSFENSRLDALLKRTKLKTDRRSQSAKATSRSAQSTMDCGRTLQQQGIARNPYDAEERIPSQESTEETVCLVNSPSIADCIADAAHKKIDSSQENVLPLFEEGSNTCNE